MAQHTEGMGREREKNNSWGLAKAECRYHKFMSARFEALPRQCDDAKWLALLPRVFVHVYLRAPCCCFSVCMHLCIILSVFPPFHLYSEGWTLADYVSALACVRHIQDLGKTTILKNRFSHCPIIQWDWKTRKSEVTEHMFGWLGRL